MSKSFYPKLALSNIIKNKKVYFPYILTCIFNVMMFYMMSAIKNNSNMSKINGAENLKFLLEIALFVAVIFSVIFLFYTNSFLIKRRKKEIGLYNILGMEKRHIGKMMLYETLMIGVVSLSAGLALGILFSKLMFLFLLKLIDFDVVLGFDVPISSVIFTLILFGAIFVVTLLYNLVKIRFSKPIELLHGGEVGEKEPKTKIILTILGLGCIGWGYWFALTVQSPLTAMSLFFIAVILVVVGTYALFTAGSIAVLKLLRKNKKFYYQTKHFTSVSGMLYRMKQNAVGLANICILSTMVLIICSSTLALYAGMKDSIKQEYPNDIGLDIETGFDDATDEINAAVNNAIKQNGVETKNYTAFHYISIPCQFENGKFKFLDKGVTLYNAKNMKACTLMSLDEFNRLNGTDYTLKDNEVIVYSKKKIAFSEFIIENANDSKTFNIKETINKVSSIQSGSYENIFDNYTIIVNDMNTLKSIDSSILSDEQSEFPIHYAIKFDVNLDKAKCIEFSNHIFDDMNIDGVTSASADNIYEAREVYYGMYGGFLFIGLFLGILFLMATVLIIYYKQISEGYEDKARFEIMQNVGMSHSEVKKTISSQVLIVFFLPLIVTGIHIAVSFRIIKKMLMLLGLTNTGLFIACTIGAMLAFCVVYGVVFIITAKSYYKIVSASQNA